MKKADELKKIEEDRLKKELEERNCFADEIMEEIYAYFKENIDIYAVMASENYQYGKSFKVEIPCLDILSKVLLVSNKDICPCNDDFFMCFIKDKFTNIYKETKFPFRPVSYGIDNKRVVIRFVGRD